MSDSDRDEHMYVRGSRAAWRQMLAECLRHLDEGDFSRERLIKERAEAIAMLRMVCDEIGDNDWPDDLALADIIEKHVWRGPPEMTTREAFEKSSVVRRRYDVSLRYGSDDAHNPGEYIDFATESAWQVWQAATAAERERCRILCNRISLEFERQGYTARAAAAEDCAAAIRGCD